MMKYRYTMMRFLNLLLILGLLGAYQLTLYLREQNTKMTELETKVSSLEAERDAFARQFGLVGDSEAEGEGIAGETGADGETGKPENSSWTDGTYTGSADGFGGKIEVSVTIDSGKISAVDILSVDGEDEAYLAIGKDVITEILDKQSADVDTISGATYSSTGIKNAVAQALMDAGKQ